jgi:hypothetical protein
VAKQACIENWAAADTNIFPQTMLPGSENAFRWVYFFVTPDGWMIKFFF